MKRLPYFLLVFVFLFTACTSEEQMATYQITFDTQTNNPIAPQLISDGGRVEQPADPAKEGATFSHWAVGTKIFDFSTPIHQDLKLIAQYTGNQYEISFDAQGGTAVEDQLIAHGNTLSPPEEPVKENYFFDGWYVDGQLFDFSATITDHLQLEAHWAQALTVVFNTNGGSELAPQTIKAGDQLEAPETPVKENEVFEGWFCDGKSYDFSASVTENIQLEAQWSIPDGETAVTYDDIAKASFEGMVQNQHILVKASIHKMMNGWAWGTETYLVDDQGNSSKDLYSHSNFGMFTFPLRESDGFTFDQTYVFDLVKDTYMSSPQLGFGQNSTDGYNGSRWTGDTRYGIEYFDAVLRGNLQQVESSAGHTTITVASQQISLPELTGAALQQLTDKVGTNVFVHVIQQNGHYESLLKDGNPQVYQTFNNL